jgi:3-phosphoshikimate 1-carboxyvinyltransferase
MNKQVDAGKLQGIVRLPPSKSDGQRALLCAALAKGSSTIHYLGPSADEQAMLRSIQQLGAKVEWEGGVLLVKGLDSFPEKLSLNCGESGLGLRLLASVCAVHAGEFSLSGEGSILKRDQSFFNDHFPRWGARCTLNEGKLPLHLSEPIQGGTLTADGSQSSQYISGLLMALPLLHTSSVLQVENMTSERYVGMTLNTLKAFGIHVATERENTFSIEGLQRYQPCTYTVEGDWSAASYWLAAAALGHPVEINGFHLFSSQPDELMLQALARTGCRVLHTGDSLQIVPCELQAFRFDATHCPDLFPALVTLAAFCNGVSVLQGVHRLANKESDRGLALQQEFGKLGLQIEIEGDEMRVYGGTKLHAAKVFSHNDHRIAMCLAIAALQIEGGLEIEGAEAVAKSYPGFWEDLSRLASGDQ